MIWIPFSHLKQNCYLININKDFVGSLCGSLLEKCGQIINTTNLHNSKYYDCCFISVAHFGDHINSVTFVLYFCPGCARIQLLPGLIATALTVKSNLQKIAIQAILRYCRSSSKFISQNCGKKYLFWSHPGEQILNVKLPKTQNLLYAKPRRIGYFQFVHCGLLFDPCFRKQTTETYSNSS